MVLNAMLETNFVANCPSALMTQEAQGYGNASQISENPLLMPDPERIVESLCSEKSLDILESILNAFHKVSYF